MVEKRLRSGAIVRNGQIDVAKTLARNGFATETKILVRAIKLLSTSEKKIRKYCGDEPIRIDKADRICAYLADQIMMTLLDLDVLLSLKIGARPFDADDELIPGSLQRRDGH